MEIKKTKFSIFRYQLLPDESRQLAMFEKLTKEEIVERKNEFLKDVVLNERNNYRGKGVSIKGKIEYVNEDDMLLLMAVEKTKEIHKADFTKDKIKDYPFVNIYINNRKDQQYLIIENNLDAFSDTRTVANVLKTAWNHKLINHKLTIYIEQTFNANEFWDTISQYQERGITALKFEFIRPNMSNITGMIKEVFPALSNNLNGHTTILSINAPQNGTLEHLDRNNKVVEGLLDYNKEGGGPPPLIRAKRVRSYIKTVKSEKEIIVEDFTGTAEELINILNLKVNA